MALVHLTVACSDRFSSLSHVKTVSFVFHFPPGLFTYIERTHELLDTIQSNSRELKISVSLCIRTEWLMGFNRLSKKCLQGRPRVDAIVHFF